MFKTRVGVIRGGPSGEYSVSLQTGRAVLKNLPEEKYSAHDILISRDGTWHMHGIPRDPHQILKHLDVVFNALHGEYGEDGKLQLLLDSFGIPYTGSGALASAVGMNKILSKGVFTKEGINTPRHFIIEEEENNDKNLSHVLSDFPSPSYIVKPVDAGSSLGMSIAKDLNSLDSAVREALKYSRKVLIEEFVYGREATCGVVDSSRGDDPYALLPVEIIPNDGRFFDYEAKYAGESQEICPGNFTPEEQKEIQNIAVLAHKALGLRHYSRADMIITPQNGVYLLEVNTLPGLTSTSLFPKSLEAVGCTMSEFLDHLVTLALQSK